MIEQLKLINTLTRDSGRTDQVGYLCFSELGSWRRGCAYAPFTGKAMQTLYQINVAGQRTIFAAVPADDLNRYVDCIDVDIDNAGGSGSSGQYIVRSRSAGFLVTRSGRMMIWVQTALNYLNNILFLNGLGVEEGWKHELDSSMEDEN